MVIMKLPEIMMRNYNMKKKIIVPIIGVLSLSFISCLINKDDIPNERLC